MFGFLTNVKWEFSMSFHPLATIMSGLWPLIPALFVLVFINRRVIFDWCSAALKKRLHCIPWLENVLAHLNHAPTLYVGYVGYAVLTQDALDYLAIALTSLICLVAIRMSFGLRLRLVELRGVEQSERIKAHVQEILAKKKQEG